MSCYRCNYITGHDPACPEQLECDHNELNNLREEVRDLKREVEDLREMVNKLRDWRDDHQTDHNHGVYAKKMEGF